MHKHALLAIIGGGNMGRAIALGALDAKLLAPGEIVICEPDAPKRATMAGWGVQVVGKGAEALERLLPVPGRLAEIETSMALAACGGQVLLAVKPQSLVAVAAELQPGLAAMPRVVVSILAGMPTEKIAEALGTACPVIRVMPNTPARLRKSMTAMCLGAGAKPPHSGLAYDLFASIGEVVKIDESLMDAFTALSGSGPAYVFYLAEAMVRAAQEVGFDRITADRVVRQTIGGAAALLADSHEPPEALRAAVTSKGGTTEAAVGELDRARVMDAVVAAIVAGRDRGRELARP
ncbi:MAG TPA: pyrroline-5-carboxylate reductase [Phycisphaerales bacterium]|nr:pyrroline-5-carboxylate reductase [Phycisphaerales bacterium]